MKRTAIEKSRNTTILRVNEFAFEIALRFIVFDNIIAFV